MTITTQARSFDKAAASYAANRPSYPPTLLDAVEELAGRPLNGAQVADIGAGTGLATALLHARRAHVIAVEPGPAMATQFRLRLPDVPVVLGDGNNLPLASESIDIVTYAQAWHWTAPYKSVPEALRVLHPGGAPTASVRSRGRRELVLSGTVAVPQERRRRRKDGSR